MKMQSINSGFDRLSDADFLGQAVHINTSMTGNPNFPNQNPAPKETDDAVTRYSTAYFAAKDLGKNAIAEKNESRKALAAILQLLGLYVMNVAQGVVTVLTSSGYPLSKERTPSHLGTPGLPILNNGNTPASIACELPVVEGGKAYNHQIAAELPTEKTIWESNPTTTTKFTFLGLEPGKQYWVRVAVSGTRKQIAYSGVVSKFAQ